MSSVPNIALLYGEDTDWPTRCPNRYLTANGVGTLGERGRGPAQLPDADGPEPQYLFRRPVYKRSTAPRGFRGYGFADRGEFTISRFAT